MLNPIKLIKVPATYIISEEGQIEIEETTEEKDLGIWVDNALLS